jgi:hypothetical protein
VRLLRPGEGPSRWALGPGPVGSTGARREPAARRGVAPPCPANCRTFWLPVLRRFPPRRSATRISSSPSSSGSPPSRPCAVGSVAAVPPTRSTRKYFLARVLWGKSTTRPPENPAFIAADVSIDACSRQQHGNWRRRWP